MPDRGGVGEGRYYWHFCVSSVLYDWKILIRRQRASEGMVCVYVWVEGYAPTYRRNRVGGGRAGETWQRGGGCEGRNQWWPMRGGSGEYLPTRRRKMTFVVISQMMGRNSVTDGGGDTTNFWIRRIDKMAIMNITVTRLPLCNCI